MIAKPNRVILGRKRARTQAQSVLTHRLLQPDTPASAPSYFLVKVTVKGALTLSLSVQWYRNKK